MRPFEDITVLDLTHVLAGPFCTYQLAVLGAEVIKIEPPASLDMMRDAGPDQTLADQSLGLHFLSQSANKKSVLLDLDEEPDRARLESLLADADVLVENYRYGVLDRLGFGSARVRADYPSLIYCSLTGFGHTGPKAHHPAYDNVIQAYSGLMNETAFVEGEPLKVGPPVLDYGTGTQAALAISAALYQRQSTGQGQHIDIAMLDAAMMLMASSVTETLYYGRNPGPHGNSSKTLPGYGCYQTRQGQLMIGAYTVRQHASLLDALGQPELAEQYRHDSRVQLENDYPQLRSRLQEILLTDTAQFWEDHLCAAGVPAARVRTLTEALASEQIRSRALLQKVPHPTQPAELTLPVAAYRFADDSGPKLTGSPPLPGEHDGEYP